MDAEETRRAVIVIQTALHAHGIDVSVLADGRRVIGYFARRQYAAIAEGVLAIRIDIFRIEIERKGLREFEIEAYIRVGERKRTTPHLRAYVHAFLIFKIRPAGGQIDISRRTKLSRRLEDIGLLALIELDLLHIIERETA